MTHSEHPESLDVPPVAPSAASATDLGADELSSLQRRAAEADEYKDKYLRSLAEMENVKKRLQKERGELVRFANEQLIVDLLAPLDNLENALKFADQASAEVQHWAMGFQMIVQQIQDTLQRSGAHSFSSEGQPFDPNLHEAVEVEQSETHPPGIVLKEFVKGYKMGDRVIRPARVKVSQHANPSTN